MHQPSALVSCGCGSLQTSCSAEAGLEKVVAFVPRSMVPNLLKDRQCHCGLVLHPKTKMKTMRRPSQARVVGA